MKRYVIKFRRNKGSQPLPRWHHELGTSYVITYAQKFESFEEALSEARSNELSNFTIRKTFSK